MADKVDLGSLEFHVVLRGIEDAERRLRGLGSLAGSGGGGVNPVGGAISPFAASATMPPAPSRPGGRGMMDLGGFASPASWPVTAPMAGGFGPIANQMYGSPIGPPPPPGFGGTGQMPPPPPGLLRRAYNLGQTNIMGTGMLMQLMFGGWEVASAFGAAGAANRFGMSNPNNLEGQMGAWNKALDRITGGPIGSMVGLFGGAGRSREQLDAILGAARSQDAFTESQANLGKMKKQFGRAAEIAGAGPLGELVSKQGELSDALDEIKTAENEYMKAAADRLRSAAAAIDAKALEQSTKSRLTEVEYNSIYGRETSLIREMPSAIEVADIEMRRRAEMLTLNTEARKSGDIRRGEFNTLRDLADAATMPGRVEALGKAQKAALGPLLGRALDAFDSFGTGIARGMAGAASARTENAVLDRLLARDPLGAELAPIQAEMDLLNSRPTTLAEMLTGSKRSRLSALGKKAGFARQQFADEAALLDFTTRGDLAASGFAAKGFADAAGVASGAVSTIAQMMQLSQAGRDPGAIRRIGLTALNELAGVKKGLLEGGDAIAASSPFAVNFMGGTSSNDKIAALLEAIKQAGEAIRDHLAQNL